MHHKLRGLRTIAVLLVLVATAAAVSACGSSSGDANKLLKQTFSGSHTVNSGNLNFAVILSPSGSSTLTGPISLSFGGPFQSLGKGQLPESNFNISVNALGRSGSLGILSTGKNGFVVLQGTGYQLPPATFQKLESSFSQITASPGSGSNAGTLSKLGIDPLHWLVNPSIVGSETVGGTETTHIRAGVNVAALLTDLNTFLQKASSLGVTGTARVPSSLSPSTRTRIASEVKNPTFDVWTGNSDKTVRKLAIKLTLPVTGQISTLLGGLSAAQVGVTMQYANLNQPQTITAPTTIRPFTEFATKLKTFLSSVQGTVTGGSAGAGTTGTGTTGTGTTGTGTTGSGSATGGKNVQNYSRCIQAAGQNIAKMQQCAALLNAK